MIPSPAARELELYIVGNTALSARAITCLRRICREHLPECRLRIVDLREDPQQARAAQIVATPTLIRKLPQPVRRLVGDLTDRERLFPFLGLDMGAT